MLDEVLSYLPPGGNPNIGVAGDVFESLLKGAHSMRTTHLIIVRGYAHHGAAFSPPLSRGDQNFL